MTKFRIPGLGFLMGLQRSADEARQAGHAIEAALILFQSVEELVRIAICQACDRNGVSAETTKKCTDPGTQTSRLLLHLCMLDPTNPFLDDLRKLNERRNRLVHRLFTKFDSMKSLRSELDCFCDEAIRLETGLEELLREAEGGP